MNNVNKNKYPFAIISLSAYFKWAPAEKIFDKGHIKDNKFHMLIGRKTIKGIKAKVLKLHSED